MALVLVERTIGPITLLELGPRIIAENASELRDKLERLLAAGRSAVLLDCSGVDTLDSFGVGALVRAWISMRRRGGRLALLCPSSRVTEILDLVHLHKVLDCYDDLTVALHNF